MSRAALAERLLLVEAGLFLSLARAALLLPSPWIAACLGRPGVEPGPPLRPGDERKARRVAWAVAAAARRVPFAAVCLPQALAAKLMLGWRGIPTTVHVGVRRSGGHELAAHAWLSSGPLVLTGRTEAPQYVEIACFSSPAPH